MGVAATPKSKDGTYWTHSESKEIAGSEHKCFDHHPFYVLYTPMKTEKGVWGFPLEKIFPITFPTIP